MFYVPPLKLQGSNDPHPEGLMTLRTPRAHYPWCRLQEEALGSGASFLLGWGYCAVE
jgi:hypothetical protein